METMRAEGPGQGAGGASTVQVRYLKTVIRVCGTVVPCDTVAHRWLECSIPTTL